MLQNLSAYVHIPFCARRCGYCDFNTYTATELGSGASQANYADQVIREIDLAATALPLVSTGSTAGSVPTVFFGGGTPTLLPSSDLVKILRHLNQTFGLLPDAEVTTEANPDSVTEQSINELAAGGFTRISFGMQSAVPHVLRTLDRTHNMAQIPVVVEWARAAGLRVSLDLIYGTPGETIEDWRRSVEAALATGVDHISAYALHVEPHTKMGRLMARGQLPEPDDDDEAEKYELADELFTAAGLEWYEISNWARGGINGPNACQHNLAYWRGQNWWGFGPGAHSYLQGLPVISSGSIAGNPLSSIAGNPVGSATGSLAGRRWWNVKHPARYAQLLSEVQLPIEDAEELSPDQAALERVMLGLRLADGLPMEALEASRRDMHLANSATESVAELVSQGLLDDAASSSLRLTRKGRLLADTVVRALT